MSSRYTNAYESRFSRDRSRSPGRYDRRASSSYPGFSSNNIPRGPKALEDASRPSIPGANTAPSGPRGRGYGSRPDYREPRDLPPASNERDRDRERWRERDYSERDFDRRDRERRISPRGRSPPRDFRDYRDNREHPRDLDTGRARRGSRDGPLSASSTYSDPPSFTTGFSRGGFGRGRGRGDRDFRGRGRGHFPDERDRDRDHIKPRSRSRGPLRRDRDFQRPDPRVEDGSYGFKEEPPFEADDPQKRVREQHDRNRERVDRDFDHSRRDTTTGTLIAQQTSLSAGPSTPRSPYGSSPWPPPGRSGPTNDGGRRVSAGVYPPMHKDSRRDVDKSDYFTSRAEISREKYAQRAESPPPQVPAFGSFPQFKTPYTGLSSNVWRAPVESKPAESAAVSSTPTHTNVVPREAPTAPKSQTNAAPPAAPRLARPLSERLSAGDLREQDLQSSQDSRSKEALTPSRPTTPQHPSANKANLANPSSYSRTSATRATDPTTVAPTGPRSNIPGSPQAGLRSISTSHSLNSVKSPAQVPLRSSTPPTSAPSGPRGATASGSPKGLNANIPTGPRGIRANIPTRPGPPIDRNAPGAPWQLMFGASRGKNQWIRPDFQPYPQAIVPAKRDVLGEEIKQENANVGRDVIKKEASPDPLPKSPLDRAVRTLPGQGLAMDGQVGAQEKPKPDQATVDNVAGGETDIARQPTPADVQHDSPVDPDINEPFSDDDDGVDLDEDDLAGSEEKFAKDRARLKSQKIDLSHRQLRPSIPVLKLGRFDRLLAVEVEIIKFISTSSKVQPPREARIVRGRGRKLAKTSIPTPKAEESEDAAMSDEVQTVESPKQNTPQSQVPTPDPTNLPYLGPGAVTPTSEQNLFQDALALQTGHDDDFMVSIAEDADDKDEASTQIRLLYANAYKSWRRDVYELDREKEIKEREEREQQQLVEPLSVVDSAAPPPTTPGTETRRAHKFNTNLDIERALEESMNTLREEQEKARREVSQAKPDYMKEAVIPDMMNDTELKRSIVKDFTTWRNPADVLSVYGFVPPEDSFTQSEHSIMVAAYQQFPKKWGRIAQELLGRSYKECINHYYATKWSGEYKDNRSKTGKRGGRAGGRGRGGTRSLRGRSNALISGMDTKPDLYEGNEYQIPASSTETGRPRRAAAPVNFGAEKDTDIKQGTTATTGGRKSGTAKAQQDGAADQPATKGTKRGKGVGKEKTQRKTKGTSAPLAPAGSPPKAYRSLDGAMDVQLAEEVTTTSSLEDATLLASLSSQSQPNMDRQTSYFEMTPKPTIPTSVPPERPPTSGGEKIKSQGQVPQRTGPSSYWSVPEVTDFPKNIAHFGSDWNGIADHMGTKTPAMVKNYFTRLVGGSRPELASMATEADQRRERGEDMGPPPVPTPINKRHYHNSQPAAPRPLAPNPEVVEVVEDSSPPLKPQIQASHASPRNLAVDARRPGSSYGTLSQNQPPASSKSIISQTPQPTSQPTKRPVQASPMGIFSESRVETRPPTLGGPISAKSQEQQVRAVQPTSSVKENAGEQYRRHLIAQQEHALEVQAKESQNRLPPQGRERAPSGPGLPPQHVSSLQPTETSQVRTTIVEHHHSVDVRRSPPPPPPALQQSRPSQSTLRHRIDPPSHIPRTASPINTPIVHSYSNPPSREENRPQSVSASVSFANPIAHPPLPAAAPPKLPQEPRKTSNLLSILNSEPEEPRARKKPVEQSSATSTPTHTVPPLGFPPPGPSFARQDSHGEAPTPASQSVYQRDPFGHRQLQHPSQSAPRLSADFGSRETNRDSTTRQDWAQRSGYPSFPRSNSPQSQSLRMSESRPAFPHRSSIFSPLNEQARHNPSPPPHPGYAHSRTPSFQHTQTAQAPAQQTTSSLGQSSQILQPNPYAATQGPQSTTRTPAQSMQPPQQPPQQQQPPMSYHTSSHLTQAPHQRQMSIHQHREHEALARQHEEHREREREQAQAQAQAKAQVHNTHAMAQNRYTPIQHSESRFAPPARQTTPLQHQHQPPPPSILQPHHSGLHHDSRFPSSLSREDPDRLRMEQQQQQARWVEEDERRRSNYARQYRS